MESFDIGASLWGWRSRRYGDCRGGHWPPHAGESPATT